MPADRALHAYKNEKLNCAQSVLHAFKDSHGVSDDAIIQAKAFGGGRADQGLCGALHSALSLLPTPADKAQLRAAFKQAAGADTCREIRRSSRIPCSECVRLAASLLAAQAGSGSAPSPGATP